MYYVIYEQPLTHDQHNAWSRRSLLRSVFLCFLCLLNVDPSPEVEVNGSEDAIFPLKGLLIQESLFTRSTDQNPKGANGTFGNINFGSRGGLASGNGHSDF